MGGKDKNVTEHPANSGVFLLVRNVKQPCDGYLPHLGVDSPSKTATILPPVCSVVLSYREPSMIRQSLQRLFHPLFVRVITSIEQHFKRYL